MAGKFDIATFVKDQKNYFKEAAEHWDKILDAKLPACDDYDVSERNGTVVWRREGKIVLELSKGMQWIIEGPDCYEYYYYYADTQTKECIEQLQSLLGK